MTLTKFFKRVNWCYGAMGGGGVEKGGADKLVVRSLAALKRLPRQNQELIFEFFLYDKMPVRERKEENELSIGSLESFSDFTLAWLMSKW
jgi:hypothetical protein